MFPALTQTVWLLFGALDGFATQSGLRSCQQWSYQGVPTRQVLCICQPIAQLTFCAGDIYSPESFLEVYGVGSGTKRPYLHLKLDIQGDQR